MHGCARYDFNEMVSGKTQLQLVQDEGQSHVMGDLDFKVSQCNLPRLASLQP